MTTVDGSGLGSANTFDGETLQAITSGSLGTHTSSTFVISDADFTITAQGTGLSYGGGHPSGGTISSLTIQQGISTMTWSGFNVLASSLWQALATGNVAAFDNLLFSGNDTFNSNIGPGGGGNFFNGYGGDDVFNYKGDFSILSNINGGDGNDTLVLNGDYSNADPGLILFDNTLTSVENIVMMAGNTYRLTTADGTVAAGATLSINASALQGSNTLYFNGSAETNGRFSVTGGNGNDYIIGGAGNDIFNGGAGNDTVDCSSANGITVNLSLTTAQFVSAGQGSDTFISIENIVSSGGNDTLTGNASNNIFYITGGKDEIDGGDGSDTVSLSYFNNVTVNLGASGTQTIDFSNDQLTLTSVENITGGGGNDILSGNAGDNIINGGGGNDTLAILNTANGVTIDFSGKTPKITGGNQGHDTLISIENVAATGFDDVFIANAKGGLSFDGGGGNDIVSFAAATNAVYIDLNNDQEYGLTDGMEDFSLPTSGWRSVEGAIGSRFDDIIQALSQQDGKTFVDGGGGNDQITSYVGTVNLNGGAGDDTITLRDFVAGDKIDGGTGHDTVFLSLGVTATEAIFSAKTLVNVETLQLDIPFEGTFRLVTKDGNVAAGKTLTIEFGTDLENTVPSTLDFDGSAEKDGNFKIIAGCTAATVALGAGNDTFFSGGSTYCVVDISRGGSDKIVLGRNSDTITAGATLDATDRINGGGNGDVLIVNGDYSAGVTFKAGTIANIDTLLLKAGHSYSFVENDGNVATGADMTVDGSALGATDVMVFKGGHETDGTFILEGGAGQDWLAGGAGADRLTGGRGADRLAGGGGGDTFLYADAKDSTGSAHDTIAGFDFATDKLDLTQIVSGIDTAITHGRLSTAHFDDQLTQHVDATALLAHHAVLFTANSGGLAGQTYLVVDLNGTAGYQSGGDLVVHLTGAFNTASLSTSDFI